MAYYKEDPSQLSEYQIDLIKDKIKALENEQPKPSKKFKDIEDMSPERSESPIEVDPIEERGSMPKRGVVDKYSPQQPSTGKKVTHPVNEEIDYAMEVESLDDTTPREPDNL